jgi:AraC-like DNA-binding protein
MRVVAVRAFSTDDYAPDDRLTAWSDFTSGALFGAQYSVYSPEGLHARQRTVGLGDVGLFSFSSNAHAVERTAALVEQFPKRAVMISLVLSGRAMFYSADRMCTAGPGEMLIYPASRPYLMAFQEGTSQLLLDIPEEYLGSAGLSIGQDGCIQVDRTVQTAARIDPTEFARLEPLLSGTEREARAASAGLAGVLARLDTRLRRQEATGRLEAAMRHIERHSADPDLDVASIAGAVGVSPRQVSRAFLLTGRSPMQCVTDSRIRTAQRLLAETAFGMDEIATASGFGSASVFSRTFRRAAGMSPREFRMQSAPHA